MKQTLTTEQLQQIENKLYNDYDFYYDDSKYEIIDHIASEIEDQMQTSTFQFAFDTVFDQWKSKLQETEWNGNFIYGRINIPMFYKQKLNRSFRIDLLLGIILTLIFPVFLYCTNNVFDLKTLNILGFVNKVALVSIALFLNVYTFFKYKYGTFTTVYGQIAVYRNMVSLIPLLTFMVIVFSKSNILDDTESFNSWLMLMISINAFYMLYIIKYCNYFRHLKMVNQIKKVKFNF